ncbi:MAG: hypothetical protein KKB22_04910 [Candidatus Omnitrophica bacterium]|nr:hypothetical protein [Candidatus Omnitrophota bacterium]
MRWYDKNIGRIFCFILTLQRRFYNIFRKNRLRYQKPSKILFIKLAEQGSTILAYPAFKKAQDLVGKDNIYFMVFKENRPILDILDLVSGSNIIEVSSENALKFICSAIKAIGKARKEKIDAVVDMGFFSRATAIFSYLCGADKRVGLHCFGYGGPYRGDLFTHKLLYNPYLHIKFFFVSLLEALNHAPSQDNKPMIFEIPKITDYPFTFLPTEDEQKLLIKKIMKLKNSVLSWPIIILNPKIQDLLPLRRWPEENYIKLAKKLLEKFPKATIIITGPIGEKEKSNIMASNITGAVSLAGRISLRELLVLYFISDVLVTTDSGPAHFSTLTPIKSVVLFGPETPFLYGQSSERIEVVAAGLVCSPCVNVYNARTSLCVTGECLRSIKVEDVAKKVEGFLRK